MWHPPHTRNRYYLLLLLNANQRVSRILRVAATTSQEEVPEPRNLHDNASAYR